MAKVKFIASGSFAPFHRGEDVGEVSEVSEELGKDLVAAGVCEFVEEASNAPEPNAPEPKNSRKGK